MDTEQVNVDILFAKVSMDTECNAVVDRIALQQITQWWISSAAAVAVVVESNWTASECNNSSLQCFWILVNGIIVVSKHANSFRCNVFLQKSFQYFPSSFWFLSRSRCYSLTSFRFLSPFSTLANSIGIRSISCSRSTSNLCHRYLSA